MTEQQSSIQLNLEDIQAMFSEKDMQILQLRSMIRDMGVKNRDLEDQLKKLKPKDDKKEKK